MQRATPTTTPGDWRSPWWLARSGTDYAVALDRRSGDRFPAGWRVVVSAGPQRSLPVARALDASCSGMLIAFDAPIGLVVGEHLLSTVQLGATERLLLLGRVARIERCSDFQSYVAVAFDEGQPDLADWSRSVRSSGDIARLTTRRPG